MPHMTCFFRKLHDMWEANVNKVNAIFFCRHSKPTWRVGVKHKWGESNIYLWAKRAKPSIWPFLWKLGDMLELNVHKVDSFFCKHSEPVLPYYLFLNNFFASAASPPPGFFKDCMACYFQMLKRWIHSFFVRAASPPTPMTCFFVKIAWYVRVKHIRWIQFLF